MKLAALRLFVHDLATARRFYESMLGLRLQVDGAARGFCTFDLSGVTLVVESVAPEANEDEQSLVGRFTGVSFAVADIQIAWRQLQAGGVYFSGAPERQAWGGWLATFEDPAGNQLQIVQNPA